jgi:beta-galactosidase
MLTIKSGNFKTSLRTIVATLLLVSGALNSRAWLSWFRNSKAARESINLDGVWNFATDPDNTGESERWYLPETRLPTMPREGYSPNARGEIKVPGVWSNQGYGTATDQAHHNFIGKGWYKKTIKIPSDWQDRHIFLKVTGVMRYSKIWVDQHYLGEHIGFLSVQEHDITSCVKAGETATVTIQVDSKQRWEIDAMTGAASQTTANMNIALGGIWGHVLLEARSNAWLSDLFVQPDVTTDTCLISAQLNEEAALSQSVIAEVLDNRGKVVARIDRNITQSDIEQKKLSVRVALPDAQLWSPETPYLYTARLSLQEDGKKTDEIEERFGMRNFTIDGYRLLLNGQQIMLRGIGDDHVYPGELTMPSDKELHLRQLSMIKSYGFNHVRHHSTVMPPEYYDACDELGIIVTVEFPILYVPYIPLLQQQGIPEKGGKRWRSKVPPGTDPQPAMDTYVREWEAVIKRYRNNPCVLCWVMGNELWEGYPPRHEFKAKVDELDPHGFFADTDGMHLRRVTEPENDRDTLDIYFAQFREASWDVFGPNNKYVTSEPRKPVISHETGNYTTFTNPDIVRRFSESIVIPFWLTNGVDRLQQLGLLKEAEEWSLKSDRLYALQHKYNIECLRKNRYISGYHWWLFQDYWTTSGGLVDYFFRPKDVAKDEVLTYNRDVVLLQDGLEPNYRSNTPLNLRLMLSNFCGQSLNGSVNLQILLGDNCIKRETIKLPEIANGDVADAGSIELPLPDVKEPALLRVTAKLLSDNAEADNSWESRIFPADIHPENKEVVVYNCLQDKKLLAGFNCVDLPQNEKLSSMAVYVTDNFEDDRLAAALELGAAVVCLANSTTLPFLSSHKVSFKSSWWKAGRHPGHNHTGTYVYDNPVTAAMTPDGWCDGGWRHLMSDAHKFIFDDQRPQPEIFVRALPSLLRVDNAALLFSVRIGKGSLIVSGFNHAGAAGRPENEWLLARLLDYATTFPQPQKTWPALLLKPVYAAPEGCLPGFKSVVSTVPQLSEVKVVNRSYKAERTTMYACRQTQIGNAVTWETVPYPETSGTAKPCTFVFSGALGYLAQPKTAGFALDINGKEALRFDVSDKPEWRSSDGNVQMRFDVRIKHESGDRFGLFHLTVPSEMLTPGKPCRLTVRSLSQNSRRWFGLHHITELR